MISAFSRVGRFANSARCILFQYESFRCVNVCLTQQNRLAGHAHWQNVRHNKAANDKLKSKAAVFYLRLVAKAVKEGGSRDPKLNSQLASVMDMAKSANVPMTTLQRSLNSLEAVEPYVMELQGPGGIFILVESCNKQFRTERNSLTAIAKKYGCKIIDVAGTASRMFNHMGAIICEAGSCSQLANLDSATELGIEIGAADVTQLEGTDGDKTCFQFECTPHQVSQLRRSLEAAGARVLESDDHYIPLQQVIVPEGTSTRLSEMYDRFRREMEMVDRIFDNVQVEQ